MRRYPTPDIPLNAVEHRDRYGGNVSFPGRENGERGRSSGEALKGAADRGYGSEARTQGVDDGGSGDDSDDGDTDPESDTDEERPLLQQDPNAKRAALAVDRNQAWDEPMLGSNCPWCTRHFYSSRENVHYMSAKFALKFGIFDDFGARHIDHGRVRVNPVAAE